jgi:DNA-binding NarL/FixJ family response regulator
MNDSAKPLQVFIVEDSPLLRERLDAAVLAAGGIVVGHSEAANDAIADLARAQPDVIIIDIQLRSGTGFDVLKALQITGRGRSATKIVLTNHANAEYRERSFQLGADAFFDKSSEASQVLELINRLAA